MLINHCHVALKGFGPAVETNPRMGTLSELRRIMQALDIERAVAFAPFEPQDGVEANQWLAQELENYPEIVGFAAVKPSDEDAPAQIEASVQRGLVGLKLHPPVMEVALDDPAIEPYWQAAEDLGLPIAIHTGSHGWYLRRYMPILLDDVAQRHPNLNLIIEHLGGIALFDQALAVLHNNSHCYAGITSVSGSTSTWTITPQRLQVLLDTVGPSRMIFGTDYPWHEDSLVAIRDDIAWIRSWGLSAEDEANVLGGNMERMIAK